MSDPILCPTCGAPHIDKALSVTVYFTNSSDRESFVKVVKEVLPGARVQNVPKPDFGEVH